MHAHGHLDDVIQIVREKQFKVFAMTEHMPRTRKQDLYPEEQHLHHSFTADMFERFYHHAKRLQQEVTDVHLLVGMEIEWIHQDTFQELVQLREKYELDYVVGSIHHVDEVPIDYDVATLETLESRIGTEEMFQRYFDQQYEMLRKVQPLVIGHFDLIRMWRYNHPLSEQVWIRIHRNIDFIVSYGGVVELNSRAWKKGLPGAYPLPDILQVMIERNVRFTLSDDSHGPRDVAMHYDRLLEYCKSNGIRSVFAPWKSSSGLELREFSLTE
jgi:histidinol-phosphatase (PHP family)